MSQPIVLFLWAVSLVFSLTRCATAAREEKEAPITPTYTLSTTEPVVHPAPLPIETSILVHWKIGEREITRKSFRAWDFNRDGRFEMLEVLADGGKIRGRAYDFDGDGKIDLKQAVDKEDLLSSIFAPSIPTENVAKIYKVPGIDDAAEFFRTAH